MFSRIKKGQDQGKEKCHGKSMVSNEVNENVKIYTQHVPLRQNTEEEVRGKELETVWDDASRSFLFFQRVRFFFPAVSWKGDRKNGKSEGEI